MYKPTKRKAFNFLRSYFDVVNELQNDKDKVDFLMAVVNKQFLDEDPKDLSFVVNLCYASQKHAIESSVKGYLRTINTDIQGNPQTIPPTIPMIIPLTIPPTIPMIIPKEEEEKEEEQVEEEVKVKEKHKEKYYRCFLHLKISFDELEKLKVNYDIKKIDSVLDSIENYKLNKNYTSLYLTAKKWLEKEPKKNDKPIAPSGYYYDKNGVLQRKIS